MSSQNISHTQPHSSTTAWLTVFAFPALVAVGIARRIQERRVLNQLLSLPDHELNDIGLQRHELQRQSLQSLWSRTGA